VIETGGLHHIHLAVRDLDAALLFYKSVFGMEEQFRSGASMVFLSTPGSSDLITLNQDESQRDQAGKSGGIAHFGFKLRPGGSLDSAVREVERAGGTLVSRGEHAPGVPYAYVRDPDGYVIELGNP
jgi:catechol 2,3-dioxygenase-like lactoylglutathione lyase family enzyme